MKKICALFFNLTVVISMAGAFQPDTIITQKALIVGFDVAGPAINILNSDVNNYEGYLSYRINHKFYGVIEAGYGSYQFSQYNYSYSNQGYFSRIGIDINMLKPEIKTGNNYAGIGLRYGLSNFIQETTFIEYENYWGTYEGSIPESNGSAHFLEFTGGLKGELFKNVFIGWTLRLKLLLSCTSGEDNRPVNIPGMSVTDGGINPGITYYIAWQIPFKKGSE